MEWKLVKNELPPLKKSFVEDFICNISDDILIAYDGSYYVTQYEEDFFNDGKQFCGFVVNDRLLPAEEVTYWCPIEKIDS